jgi:magnesium transporter
MSQLRLVERSLPADIVEIDKDGEVVDFELDPDDIELAIRRAHRAGGFLLCTSDNPECEEMDELADRFGLHPLAAADAATGKQQPKIQNYPQHLFIVMWTLDPEGEATLGQVFLFVRQGLLVCVQRSPSAERLDARELMSDRRIDLGAGVMGAAYRIMSRIAADYTEVASHIEADLEEVEGQVFDEHVQEDAAKIYRLRLRVGKLGRAVATFAAALEVSREHLEQLVIDSAKLGPNLRDLHDDVAATATLSVDQNRALDGIVATHENNVATRQGKDMRKISALAALLAIPTVIAGIYGMNFKNIPLVQWQFGWLVIGATMFVLDLLVFAVFKRQKWL